MVCLQGLMPAWIAPGSNDQVPNYPFFDELEIDLQREDIFYSLSAPDQLSASIASKIYFCRSWARVIR